VGGSGELPMCVLGSEKGGFWLFLNGCREKIEKG
jgi:hypothetical protein